MVWNPHWQGSPSTPIRLLPMTVAFCQRKMMTEKLHTKSFPSAVEVAVYFIVTAITAQSAAFHTGFSGFWTLMPISALSLFLAIYALLRSRRTLGVCFFLVALLIAIPNVLNVRKMFPLQYRVAPCVFSDATVTQVLQHMAKSNDESPSWRFHVSTRELARQRVSMTIKPGARLDDALELLMTKVDGRYRWNWHKSCGNESSPLCASFYVASGELTDATEFAVLISRDLTIDMNDYDEENGQSAVSPSHQ